MNGGRNGGRVDSMERQRMATWHQATRRVTNKSALTRLQRRDAVGIRLVYVAACTSRHACMHTYIHRYRHVQVDSETDCNQCGGTPCPVQISRYQAMQLACTIFVHGLIRSCTDGPPTDLGSRFSWGRACTDDIQATWAGGNLRRAGNCVFGCGVQIGKLDCATHRLPCVIGCCGQQS